MSELIDRYEERYDLEVVLVNDGSQDDSRAQCLRLTERFPGVARLVDLSRNFGEHSAVLAGLHHASGDIAVVMDDDFQNPPEDVGVLVAALVDGEFDVVYAQIGEKKDPRLRNLGSRFNDRVATVMLGKPKGLYLSSFKCLNRFMIDEVRRYDGPYPYLDGLILRVTRNIGVAECRHEERATGASGYTMRKLAALWLNMFTNFSIAPLRAAVFVGFGFALLGGVLSIGVVIEKLAVPETSVGWPSLAILVMVFSGIQLMVLGLIGEYLGRQFLTTNRTPQFVVRHRAGFETSSQPPRPGGAS